MYSVTLNTDTMNLVSNEEERKCIHSYAYDKEEQNI